MQIHAFPLGPLSANCYIVSDSETKRCSVIDPGGDADKLLEWLRQQGMTLVNVFLTHGHYDHVGGTAGIHEAFPEVPIYIHEADTKMPVQLRSGMKWTHNYDDGDVLTMDSVEFRVLHTPGHSEGSVCLLAEDVLFSGDTLFAGSCGRTDLPGGSWKVILQSLKRLSELEGYVAVLPGHGGTSDISTERAENPYLREAMG